eukprot:3250499-Lingulodinium_polyedra.AAC.1
MKFDTIGQTKREEKHETKRGAMKQGRQQHELEELRTGRRAMQQRMQALQKELLLASGAVQAR